MAMAAVALDAMSTITPQRLCERLESADDEILLLDIRPQEAFEDWHIPGSKHVDVYDELQADPASATEALDGLPRDAEIVTVCGKGVVSETATEVLQEMGYDAKTLADGLAGWGRVHRDAEIPTDAATLVQVARPGTGCLSYLIVSDGEAAVVDPSQYTDRYRELLDEYGAELEFVLETHAHADHVSGARDLASTADVPHYLHPADATADSEATGIEAGSRLGLGSVEIETFHTPGHTRGSVTFDVEGAALLTGDTLFLDSVGRPDLEGGDRTAVRQRAATLHESLQRLLDRPDAALVLPAHSPDTPHPPTTASLEAVRDRNGVLGEDRSGFVAAVATDIPEPPAHHERIKQANLGRAELEAAEARDIELGPNQCAAQ